MPDLSNLLWLVPVGILFHYWWQSGQFKGKAREMASRHCQQLNLQLLDYSMVITGYRPVRNAHGNFVIQRTYQFEFTSTGARRHRGLIVLLGSQVKSIDLEAYIIPDQHEQ